MAAAVDPSVAIRCPRVLTCVLVEYARAPIEEFRHRDETVRLAQWDMMCTRELQHLCGIKLREFAYEGALSVS